MYLCRLTLSAIIAPGRLANAIPTSTAITRPTVDVLSGQSTRKIASIQNMEREEGKKRTGCIVCAAIETSELEELLWVCVKEDLDDRDEIIVGRHQTRVDAKVDNHKDPVVFVSCS